MLRVAEQELVVYADGPDSPLPDPALVMEVAGLSHPEAGPDRVADDRAGHGSAGRDRAGRGRVGHDGVTGRRLVLGWIVRRPVWLGATDMDVDVLVIGPGTRAAVDAGVARPVPTRLSSLPTLLAGRLRPEVMVVGAQADPSGGWRLVGGSGWNLEAVRRARKVVIERWPGPPPAGQPALPLDGGPGGPELVAVIEREEPADAPQPSRTSPEHEAIAGHVAGLVPDGATIQWGPGSIGAGVVAALERPVRVRSGLVTDELVSLRQRGLLAGPAEAAYAWGGTQLRAMVAEGSVVLREVAYTHDLTALSRLERFVAINTALQVGLDGSVNVESVGGRAVASPGGHPDFALAAARSPGGLSIVALASTVKGKSTIVGRVEAVTTPRCDVDVVVTEHGVADLRGTAAGERAELLRAVAAPEHRADLAG